MPEAHEIIGKLNTETPRKTMAEELKGKWLEENPGKVPQDFDAFKFKNSGQDWKTWEVKTTAIIEDSDIRWKLEKVEIPALVTIDTTLKVQASFESASASASYKSLLDVFDDHFSFTNPNAVWYLPNDPTTRAQWQTLSNTTQAEVQRNATNLASVVANTRQIATDEVRREKGAGSAVTDWQNSQLYEVLEALEGRLKQWDRLLASDALPDRNDLNQGLDLIDEQFFQFYREHVPLYDQDTTVGYIRFQMLATMKSLAEKVAAQFAARAGKPSFSGMYGLICDVPNRGSYDKGEATAKILTTTYADQSSKAWTNELEFRNGALKNVDRETAKLLQAKFADLAKNQSPVNLQGSFDKWSMAYKSFDPNNPVALTEMRQAIGEIAFGIRKYKEAVDAVLQSSDPKSPVNSPQVQGVRQSYHETFDGFVMQRQQEIVFCKSLF